jgi:hypothetical protein
LQFGPCTVEGGFGLAVEAHKCRHRTRSRCLGMGLQGLEVTASSSEGLSFTIRSVACETAWKTAW